MPETPASTGLTLADLAPRLATGFGSAIGIGRARLDNGLRVLTVRSPTAPVLAVQLHIAAGNRDVPPDRTGLAHIVEHMMFKLPAFDYDEAVEDFGGSCNAYTMQDTTCYTCEALPETLPRLLELEARRFTSLEIEAEALAAELDVILEERLLSVDNNPTGWFEERFDEELFPDHPYGWSVLGSAEHIRSTTPEACLDFLRRRYVAGNMVLAVAGPLEHEAIVEVAARHLGALPPGDGTPRFEGNLTHRADPRDLTVTSEQAELSTVAFGGLLPGAGAPESARILATADLLSVLLGWGDSSRLVESLVHRDRLALYVDVTLHDYELGAAFTVDARSTGTGPPDRLRAGIEKELESLAREEVPDAELEKARAMLATDFVRQLKTAANRAELAGSLEIVYPDLETGLEGRELMLEIDAAEVRQLAASLLEDPRRTWMTLVAPSGSDEE